MRVFPTFRHSHPLRLDQRSFPTRRSSDLYVATWIAGFVVGIPAGLLDIGTLADLSNIGTLFAFALVAGGVKIGERADIQDRKSTRLNSSHVRTSYPVFCLKKSTAAGRSPT